MPIEQLRYTWAKKGLQGYGKYQPVAASSGLYNSRGPVWDLALRLCRYHRPAGTTSAPRSFGWISHGDLRFAFSRCFLPDAQQGHPGNFAAHVIVGTPAELPASLILSSYWSDFWWTGPSPEDEPTTGGQLPTVDPAAMNPGLGEGLLVPRGTDSVSSRVLSKILDGEQPLFLDGTPDELVSALQNICMRLPTVVEQRSFSTLEHGEQAEWFDLVRSPPSIPNEAPPSRDALLAAAYILKSEQLASLSQLLGSDTLSGTNLQRVRAVAAIMGRLSQDEELKAAELLPGLASPHTIQDVLDFDRVQEAVSVSLVKSELPTLETLLRNRESVSAETWDSLGRRSARQLGFAVPAAELIERLEMLSPLLTNALAEEFIAAANSRDDFTAPTAWPRPLIRAAGRVTSIGGPMAQSVEQTVITTARAKWLSDDGIPEPLRLRILQHLIRSKHQVPPAAIPKLGELCARLFKTDPASYAELVQPLAVSDRRIVLQDSVARLPEGHAVCLQPQHGRAIRETLAGMDVRAAFDLMVGIVRRCDLSRAALNNTIASLLDAHMALLLKDPSVAYSDALDDLISRAPDSSPWKRLLASAAPGKTSKLKNAISSFTEDKRALASAVAADHLLVLNPYIRGEIEMATKLLDDAYGPDPERVTERFLIAGIRALQTTGAPGPAVRALQEVGWYHESAGAKPTTLALLLSPFSKQGRGHAASLNRLAAQALHALGASHPQAQRDVITFFEEHLGKAAQKWLIDVYETSRG